MITTRIAVIAVTTSSGTLSFLDALEVGAAVGEAVTVGIFKPLVVGGSSKVAFAIVQVVLFVADVVNSCLAFNNNNGTSLGAAVGGEQREAKIRPNSPLVTLS